MSGVADRDGGCQPSGPLDERQLDRIYRDEAPRLVRFFRQKLRHRAEEAGDMVQETFLRFAGSAPEQGHRQPAAYLYRIARNLLVDLSRRSMTRLTDAQVPIGDHLGLSVAADQLHALEAADLMRIYRGALDGLPKRTRDAFLLHRHDELSYREIGVQLGISIPTVQYHIAKALMHIDQALELR